MQFMTNHMSHFYRLLAACAGILLPALQYFQYHAGALIKCLKPLK